jgi:hypothetical protein
MKKIVALLLFSCFVTSCGPKRLGCGPGRCEVENPTLKTMPSKNIC